MKKSLVFRHRVHRPRLALFACSSSPRSRKDLRDPTGLREWSIPFSGNQKILFITPDVEIIRGLDQLHGIWWIGWGSDIVSHKTGPLCRTRAPQCQHPSNRDLGIFARQWHLSKNHFVVTAAPKVCVSRNINIDKREDLVFFNAVSWPAHWSLRILARNTIINVTAPDREPTTCFHLHGSRTSRHAIWHTTNVA